MGLLCMYVGWFKAFVLATRTTLDIEENDNNQMKRWVFLVLNSIWMSPKLSESEKKPDEHTMIKVITLLRINHFYMKLMLYDL